MKTAGVAFTMIFNTLEMPATHVPLGLNKDGLPIGVQVNTSFIFIIEKFEQTFFWICSCEYSELGVCHI